MAKTWSAPNSTEAPVDIHVLRVHPKYPNQLYGVWRCLFRRWSVRLSIVKIMAQHGQILMQASNIIMVSVWR